jgi:hypothetical protein
LWSVLAIRRAPIWGPDRLPWHVLIGSSRTRPARQAIVRGGPVTDGSLASGAFYRPSLIEVEGLSAPIIQQEIFGPVGTFEVFDDEKGGGYISAAVDTRPRRSPPDVAGTPPSRIAYSSRQDGCLVRVGLLRA